MTKCKRRSRRGQGIVEGACALVLLVTLSAGLILLILNVGTGVFFANKIMLMTAQAAEFAAAHHTESSVQAETLAYVQALMPAVGLSPNQVTVTVAITNIDGADGAQVTISQVFPLFGTDGLHLPTQIKLTDTEFAAASIGPIVQ